MCMQMSVNDDTLVHTINDTAVYSIVIAAGYYMSNNTSIDIPFEI